MKKTSLQLLTILAIILTANPAPAATQYTVIDLGTIDGYDIARAWSINNNGQVIGDAIRTGPGFAQIAVLFDVTGGGENINLGTIGGEGGVALSINNSGQIVGVAENNAVGPTWHVTMFDSTGNQNNTGFLAESGAYSNNDYGQIVGYVSFGNLLCAAMFDSNQPDTYTNLGLLPGFNESIAWANNNNGDIVGLAYNDSTPFIPSVSRAVLFDKDNPNNNLDLGSLLGYSYSMAFSINDNGQIVGRANNEMTLENYNPRAVLFDSNNPANNTDLGTLPGYDSAEAWSINNKGQIVGRAITDPFIQDRAVLFDPINQNNINLSDLAGPDISLDVATCINDKGWIIAWGTNADDPVGQQRSFLLTPEPLGPCDFDSSGYVDLQDFALFALAWKSRTGEPNYDISRDVSEPNDGVINYKDLAVFVEEYFLHPYN